MTDIQDSPGAAEVDEEQEARLARKALESLAAQKRLAELVSPAAIDRMLGDAEAAGVAIDGPDGLVSQLTRTVLERALGAELDDHLGYAKGDPAGTGSGNSRNGSYGKTVTTTAGPVRIAVPRDRNGSFEPVMVPKGQRRLGQVDDLILSLYARGMTTRDIQAHLAEVYGAAVSPALISKVTDVVAEEITTWQTRPLDSFYAIVYIDALVVKVRDGHHVRNKSAYIAVGIDLTGVKHVLGIWVQAVEGAKFWAGVCAELANRGVRDVLIVCCDGLTGFPEAIEATWPHATVQTCTVHLIRAAMRFVSYQDRKKVAAALRPIYTAPTEEAAETELLAFADSELGKKYPAAVATWENAWERFIPFLSFPPEVRKIIYTTNSIESLNYQLRKIIKNRGHFPTDDAVIKLLWLAIRDIEDKRARQRAKQQDLPKNKRNAPARLVEGATTQNWTQALGALALAYPDRLAPYLT